MRQYVQYVGLTTEVEPLLSDLCNFQGPQQHDPSRIFQKFGKLDTFMIQPEHAAQSHHEDDRFHCAIEIAVGSSGPALVNLYFDHVHPGFPLLDKRDFLNRYRRSTFSIAPPLLAAVYTLAVRWSPHDVRPRSGLEVDGNAMQELTLKSLEMAMRQPEISTVQAGLLLFQQPDEGSWLLTAQLVAIGQGLGLHLDCSDWGLPNWEQGLRKRTAWALFMQDKWGALVHGCPAHISDANWAVPPLAEADFEEDLDETRTGNQSAGTESTRLLFCAMVSLTLILSEILETFYSVKKGHQIDTRAILERAKPIQISLRNWHASLPACIRMDNSKTQRLPCIGG